MVSVLKADFQYRNELSFENFLLLLVNWIQGNQRVANHF